MDRILITLVIIGGLALLWLVGQAFKLWLARTINAGSEAAGQPTLLYFTGEYCATCKFQQSPVVELLAAKLGGAVTIKQIDVSTQPELASKYRVLTLPTTVVVNRRGQVAYINYGLADQTKLESQLSAI